MVFEIAFGPDQSYYFSNGRQTLWNKVPEGLGSLLQNDARFRPEKVLRVALGPNLSYFVRSTEAIAWDNVSPVLQSKVDALGGWNSLEWIMFTADPNAYLILTKQAELFCNGLTQAFHDAILRYAFHGFKDICIGYDGGFALSTNNDKVSYLGMPAEFVPAWQSGKVLQVTTSTFDQFYFIEFTDGRSTYLCPKSWHAALDALRNSAVRTSSGASYSTATLPVSVVPGNMVYKTEQHAAGDSAVSGFISETASDFASDFASDLAVQMMQNWMGQ